MGEGSVLRFTVQTVRINNLVPMYSMAVCRAKKTTLEVRLTRIAFKPERVYLDFCVFTQAP